MKTPQIKNLSLYLLSGAIAMMLASVARTALSGPPDDARPADIEKAKRLANAPDNAADVKGAPLAPAGERLIAGNGVVEPAGREVKVAGATPGRIATIQVNEGDKVEKDAVLVTLDNSAESAALLAAEADFSAATAEASRTMRGLRKEDVDAVSEEAKAASARAEQSQSAYARTLALSEKGGVTADELDKAKAQAVADRATAQASDAKLRAALNGSRAEDVMVARAKAEAARARRDQAKATLDRLTIRAPQAGVVLQVKFRPGEYYVPGGAEPLVVMGDTRKLNVRMDVDERDIGKMAMGAKAHAMSDAFADKKFTGKVVDIGRRMGRKNVRTDDPTERKDTKILEVLIELDGNDNLVPGQRVVAYVSTY